MKVAPLLGLAKNWRRLLTSDATEEQIKAFREHERTGRPLGDEKFQKRLEKMLGRILRRRKPGPKKPGPKIIMYSVPGTRNSLQLAAHIHQRETRQVLPADGES